MCIRDRRIFNDKVSESSAKSERESILTESDVNDEMKAVKPEMMKRERERERNECAREMMLIFRGQF